MKMFSMRAVSKETALSISFRLKQMKNFLICLLTDYLPVCIIVLSA